MEGTGTANDEQVRLWNGPAGRAWVDAQESLDRMFQPFEGLLLEALPGGGTVLDVGCGTGAITLGAARRGNEAVGVDLSEPMLALARARAEGAGLPARFVLADAQEHAFAPRRFDAILSRFGVMFFRDPVAAFANLRRATAAGGALRAIAFRGVAENPFMTAAERATAHLLPALPPREDGAPGQFAFADGRRVRSILDAGGWTAVDAQPVDVACTLPESELVPYLTRLGPVGRLLADADAGTRAAVVEAARAAFDPFVEGDEVRWTAACWLLTARNGQA